MPIETRSNSALFKRAEQLKRWQESETNNSPSDIPENKKFSIQFSDTCIFLAACAASDLDEVERLLKLGTDINTLNVDGLTALHQACIDNNFEMVMFLVEHGCDVNRGDNEGWTPLHATASCGFISIAKYLIENGASITVVNNDGDLPIDIAESTEMEDFLSEVIDQQGVNCDEVRAEEERIMLNDAKLFLSKELDMNEKIHPRTGAYPLHVAAAKGYIAPIKILIEAGADLNAQDNDGWTALHAAAHWNQKEAAAVLAESLANMDIQNFSGQTCFDVADSDMKTFLEELKGKQTSMQKDRPEIQEILQRTSNRPPFRRRTSVTRMSGTEKSKSVMKDTRSERAQITNITLSEEECEDGKVLPSKKQPEKIIESPVKKEGEPERIPSWKKVLRRSADEDVDLENSIPEITLKRPKKLDDEKTEKDVFNKDGLKRKIVAKYPVSPPSEANLQQPSTDVEMTADMPPNRPSIPPVRDEESELQRKAHAKRVRETRRSTQGVLLEDIKSAELQYLRNTQKEAAIRQAEEIQTEKDVPPVPLSNSLNKPVQQDNSLQDSKVQSIHSSANETNPVSRTQNAEKLSSCNNPVSDGQSVTLPLRSKPSASQPEDKSPSENKTALGTKAAIGRRRRPKRRSTGVVYLDSDEGQDDKEPLSDSEGSPTEQKESNERPRHRYGSSTSISDAETSKSETSSRYSSKASLADDGKDYRKLYEDVKKENEQLKDKLSRTAEELEKTKQQLQRLTQSSPKSAASEAEKRERRSLERKISEMEEELKILEKLKNDNKRLKDENSALIRVISKLSQ